MRILIINIILKRSLLFLFILIFLLVFHLVLRLLDWLLNFIDCNFGSLFLLSLFQLFNHIIKESIVVRVFLPILSLLIQQYILLLHEFLILFNVLLLNYCLFILRQFLILYICLRFLLNKLIIFLF